MLLDIVKLTIIFTFLDSIYLYLMKNKASALALRIKNIL